MRLSAHRITQSQEDRELVCAATGLRFESGSMAFIDTNGLAFRSIKLAEQFHAAQDKEHQP